MASTDARPVPIKNTAFRVVFPLLDADGDLVTGATGLDSEVSKDQGTFADCTNEATEIATSSGVYYLDLTSTEMNADCVAVIVKTSTVGAKTTTLVLYPQETGDIKVDVQSFGGSAGTFASGRPEVNMSHIAGSAVSTSTAQIGVNVVNAGGTAWGSGAITSGALHAGAITAIQSGLATAASLTTVGSNVANIQTRIPAALDDAGLMQAVVVDMQANTVTAAAVATGAIDASALASDAGNKLADHILRRSITSARASSFGDSVIFRSLMGATSKLVNKIAASDVLLTIYAEDDITAFGTQAITSDPDAEAITELDTA